MKFEDLQKLDPNEIGSWPLVVRLVIFALIFAGVLVAGYFFIIKDKLIELEAAEAEEEQLRTEFETKQRRAASLDQYRAQLEEMRETFGAMLRQLPSETEIEALLIDISQAGLAAGLEEELFQPQREVNRDFYAELPIQMRLTGTFHEFATFASNVSALPRIVTLHNIRISPGSGGDLTMEITAKTYRYIEEDSG